MEKMPDQKSSDRRQTARIPTGAKLLHRAVGMRDYALCEVLNVTTSGIEMLAEQPLAPGTVVTFLVQSEDSPRKYYRVVGSVERRERKQARWLHVVKASNRRPWSPMFIYDVVYQALRGERMWPVPEWMFVEHDAGPRRSPEDPGPSPTEDPGPSPTGDPGPSPTGDPGPPQPETVDNPDAAPEEEEGDPDLYRALAWFAPFDEFSDMLRQFIAREQRVTRRPAGTTLVERGSMEDTSIYLIAGIVEIEAFDGKRSRIAAGTNDARYPISVLRPHAYTVIAATDVTVIMLSQDMIRQLTRITGSYRNHLGIEVLEEDSLPAELTGV